MRKRESKANDITVAALFTVLIILCSWISIPTTIPFTMQTFAVYLTLNFLGAKKGMVSIIVYLLLGFVGLPVFAGFHSGIGVLLGPNGGYMLGWLLSGLVMRGLERLSGGRVWMQAASMLAGLVVCYIAGTVWFTVLYAKSTVPVGIGTALLWCVLPFVLPDLVKLGLALGVSQQLKKSLRIKNDIM